ncbi:MAG: hypothetical protein Q9187_000626 [Circinaria calcarea]
MLHAPLTLTTAKLDISLLLKPSPSPTAQSSAPPERTPVSQAPGHPVSTSSQRTSVSSNLPPSSLEAASGPPSQTYAQSQRPFLPPLAIASSYLNPQNPTHPPPPLLPPPLAAHPSAKRPPPTQVHPSASPAKKQSKWTPEEDALIIDLRGSGMKWEDISKRLPGRSAISCRLHYQNYLERRSEWDEERKNRLARLYERLKPEMWAPLAAELGIPWRAAEAMHWQLGEVDIARRAGVTPFSLTQGASTAVSSAMPMPSSIPGRPPGPGYQLSSSIGMQPTTGPGESVLAAIQEGGGREGGGGVGLPGIAELESGGRRAAFNESRGRFPGSREEPQRRDARGRGR